MCNSHEIGDNSATRHVTGSLDMGQLALKLIVHLSSDLGTYAEESWSREMCHHQRTCQLYII